MTGEGDVRSSKLLRFRAVTERVVIVVENCDFWLLSLEDWDFMVFLMKTRRTGIEAATMVMAVSAVAKIMSGTVAAWNAL